MVEVGGVANREKSFGVLESSERHGFEERWFGY